MTKSERASLREMFGGRCAYCGCELPEKGWHADHVEPVLREWWKNTAYYKNRTQWKLDDATGMLVRVACEVEKAGMERPENDTLANMFPSCRACNIDKHASSLEGWRKQLQDRPSVCRRNYSAFRHAERFGLVQVIDKPIVFYFETIQPAAPQEKP